MKEITAYLLYKDELYYTDTAFLFDAEQITNSVEDFIIQAYIALSDRQQKELENVFCQDFRYDDTNKCLTVLLF